MASPESTIQRLRAAITDGRTANIRYRQNELQSLHNVLAENAEALATAISQDTGAMSVEVEAELFLAMDSLSHSYDSLDFQKEIKDEFLVTNEKNNIGRRIGVGLVAIQPTVHTRLFSVLAPICAAIAAGNCILLELEETTLSVDQLLKSILTKALDQDTFVVTSTSITSLNLPSHVLLDQISTSTISKTNEILSSASSRTIAIVDRTADIDAAAKAIVTARFSFQGTSSYAPDLVVVNEWVKTELFEACTKYATQLFSSRGTAKSSSSDASKETAKAIKDGEAKGQLSTFGSADFKIVDILDRSSPLPSRKVSGFYLPIIQCSSITDAVFSLLQDTSTTFLAGYFFAEPTVAKFISQHLDCHMTFVNQIPTQLLVGPASPLTHAPSYPYRYTTDMFSVARPQFIHPPILNSKTANPVSKFLSLDSKDKISSKEIRKEALKPLKPTGQAKGFAIGFFEQGIISGGLILFGLVVPALAYTSWALGRKGWELARRGK